jgi:hypothetical protein
MSRARGVRAKTIPVAPIVRCAGALAAVALALTAAPATASYKVIHTWGTPGTSGGQLEAPLTLSLDGHGSLYVGDGTRVIQFGVTRPFPNSYVGKFVKEYSELRLEDGQWVGNIGIVRSLSADEEGDIWVVDFNPTTYFATVHVFRPSGSYIGALTLAPGDTWTVTSDHHRRIFLTRSYPPGDGTGIRGFVDVYSRGNAFLFRWGTDLSIQPGALAFGPHGRRYVLDDDGIHVYTDRVRELVWGGTFSGLPLNNPIGIAVDPAGFVYVADWGNHRVLKINSVGHVVAVLTAKPGLHSGGQPFAPGGLAVARTGQVFVGDLNSARIVEFAPVGPDTKITFSPPGVAQFEFKGVSSTGSAAEKLTFECRLDAHAWKDCTATGVTDKHGKPVYGIEYRGLRLGIHKFSVRAIGEDGNVDPTPARRTVRIRAGA